MKDLLRRTIIGFMWGTTGRTAWMAWASLIFTVGILFYDPLTGACLVVYDVYLFQGPVYRDFEDFKRKELSDD